MFDGVVDCVCVGMVVDYVGVMVLLCLMFIVIYDDGNVVG